MFKVGDRVLYQYGILNAGHVFTEYAGTVVAIKTGRAVHYVVKWPNDPYHSTYLADELILIKDGNDILKELCT